jgi:predicted nucleic acid-binding protein
LKTLPKVIVVDANFIIAYCSSKTNQDDRARIEHFIERVEKAKAKVVFPMVAVAEFLVGADLAGVEFLNTLDRKAHILMADFNRAAAFELAQIDRAAIGSGDKKDESEEPWQKIKIDRQIVAIGKAQGAQLVISNDKNVRNNALRVNVQAMKIQDLMLPESARQMNLVPPPIKSIPKEKAKPTLLRVIKPSPWPVSKP